MDHDSYYRDLKHLPFSEREKENFDHPSALETELMIHHLEELRRGEEVQMPVYDFVTHSRTEETRLASPIRIILIDGILICSEPELLKMMDIKIFVDTDDDVRLDRKSVV